MQTLKVVVADPHARSRTESVRLVRRVRGTGIVEQARDGLEASLLVEFLHPDLVLTEITMPGMSGLELARTIRKSSPHTKIVFLTNHSEHTYRLLAQFLNVDGMLRKSERTSRLPALVRSIRNTMPGIDPGHEAIGWRMAIPASPVRPETRNRRRQVP